jgi:hypothetical protein
MINSGCFLNNPLWTKIPDQGRSDGNKLYINSLKISGRFENGLD